MSAEKATALVLRVVDFSESSCVVTLFTREMGKVRGLAKGGRRLKGPFESALDLLALCRVVFLRKSSDALDLLTEAKLLRRFRPGSSGLNGLYAGYYFAEMLETLTDDYDPHPELFDLAERSLEQLARGGPAARITLQFEIGALDVLGHLPSLELCVECGHPVEINARGRIAFGLLSGGVLCERCRSGKRQVVSVSAQAIETLRSLATRKPLSQESLQEESLQETGEQELNVAVRNELRGVMNQVFNNFLGRRPKTQKYLST